MKIFRLFSSGPVLLILCLWTVLCSGVYADEEPYDNENHPLRAALRKQVISVFEEAGLEAAMAKLAPFKTEMLEDGYEADKVYEHVWKEAQLHIQDPEFGYTLYEWIYLQSTDGDLSGKTPCFSNTILFTELITRSQQLGKLALAEKWAEIGQRMAEYHNGIVYDLDRYPNSTQEVHPAFPGFKTKLFPLRYSDQLNASNRASRKYVRYTKLFIHEQLMMHAFYRGDWKAAMLYAEWIKQYSDALTAEPLLWTKHENHELDRMNSDAVALQAELMWLQGKQEAALAHLEQVMKERPSYYYGTDHRRGMTRVKWRSELGQANDKDLEYLVNRIDAMSHNLYFDARLMGRRNARTRIWWYFLNDQREKAVELMTQYFEENPDFLREDWEMYLDMVMIEKDLRPENEEIFLKLLEKYRSMGHKIYEPFLYEKYARWLSWQGRYEEAVALQKEAIRLYTAFQMPEMLQKAQRTLAEFQEVLKAENFPAANSPPSPQPEENKEGYPIVFEAKPASEYRVDLQVPQVDLQPRLMHSVYPPDRIAHSHFTLANPSEDVLSGTLELRPAREMDIEKGESSSYLRFDSNPGAGEERIPFEIAPGRIITLNLESYTGHEDGGNVQIRWVPEKAEKEVLESVWTFVEGEGFGNGDFTNAGAYLNNPFYLIPIYQALLRETSDKAGTLDFRIIASERMRIEVYHLTDNQLIYIDDQGDGDLNGVGDVLSHDVNGNFLPDLPFSAGRKDTGFVLYFIPRPDRHPGPVELKVEAFLDRKWVTRTVHTVQFGMEEAGK